MGGALAVTDWTQFQAAGSIAAGATVTTRRGLWMQNLAVQTGVLTNEIGVDIEDLNMGATIIGIRSALTAANGDLINSVGADAPARFGGEVEIDGALNHDGTTAGFYGTAPIAQQAGVAVSAAAIHAACVALGLFTA